MPLRRVVVTGIGVLSPVGNNLKESWANIVSGKCGISKLEGPLYDKLPSRVAGTIKSNGSTFDCSKHFSKSELKSMSRATAYGLLAAKEAIDDAKLTTLTDEEKLSTGVAVGMGMVDLTDICLTNDALNKSYNQVSPFFVPRILANMTSGHISIKYGFRGPNHSVSTACATGAHAIGDSFRFICNADADVMICGGTEACISPLSVAGFCRLRALSTSFNDTPSKASRPFDTKRDGFVIGEGSAILVLEELEHALSRNVHIYAEILGYGLSGDASHLTAPHTDGSGAILAMRRAIKGAGLLPSDITYVNAHATSTPLGDAIEAKAINSVFESHVSDIAVSSTKGAHGHLLGAAGNLEAVFTIKAVEEGLLPPTINFESAEDLNLNIVPNEHQKWISNKRRVALKNAFGFGGTNACLCIAEFNK
ncbi:hypothetical protein RI129_006067 [Pyrocoelia pectoralis]|uniref:3-oxoacyl-[acyl-carrier-protein] synthase n=1 Tax=Pyrocoelia pectoralis TaxID=417401 RepID=A0AAN7ZJG6_9COLE